MKSQNVQKLPTPQTSTGRSRPLPPHTGGRWGGGVKERLHKDATYIQAQKKFPATPSICCRL